MQSLLHHFLFYAKVHPTVLHANIKGILFLSLKFHLIFYIQVLKPLSKFFCITFKNADIMRLWVGLVASCHDAVMATLWKAQLDLILFPLSVTHLMQRGRDWKRQFGAPPFPKYWFPKHRYLCYCLGFLPRLWKGGGRRVSDRCTVVAWNVDRSFLSRF